ncbi:hypothetical protein E2C01_024258 [Portunus trituberculatus]|uniref:Uncharacterized protein n=1 Tax=Portunus trituberculatus TaxID=210409 RepID=A0A5B7EC84_PORTR|nr:hypothetical protein [Portunus trituberculatus]
MQEEEREEVQVEQRYSRRPEGTVKLAPVPALLFLLLLLLLFLNAPPPTPHSSSTLQHHSMQTSTHFSAHSTLSSTAFIQLRPRASSHSCRSLQRCCCKVITTAFVSFSSSSYPPSPSLPSVLPPSINPP